MMVMYEFAKAICARAAYLVCLAVLLTACHEAGSFNNEINSVRLQLVDGGVANNLVINGSFDTQADPWWTTGIVPESLFVDGGALCVGVPAGSTAIWDVIVGQGRVPLEAGGGYAFEFTAWSSAPVTVKALVGEPDGDYKEFSTIYPELQETPQTFSQLFEMGESEYVPHVAFQIGTGEVDWTFCLDDVSVMPLAKENLANGSFDDEMDSWWTDDHLTEVDLASGAFCADVPSTEEVWQGLLGQSDINIEEGSEYTLTFYAAGDSQQVRAIVQDPSNYAELGAVEFVPTAEGQTYTGTFTAMQSVTNAQLMFQLGGADVPWQICIDDVSLTGGSAVPPYVPETGPRVRVNQIGYLPYGAKIATLVTDSVEPIPFSLIDSEENVVMTGETAPFGVDDTSMLNVHIIDFAEFVDAGDGYAVIADGERSYPFTIGEAVYEKLRTDALNFLYYQRSGIAIDADLVGEAYARPAGHVSSPLDEEINQGDLDVPCQPAEDSALYYGEPWTCDYTLDVVGGWYDAGDGGKYVVNGGITVFQLLNTFERTKTAPTADLGAHDDGSLKIPENENGIPDILDEARYELEFMLKMMVPEGQPLEGMAHHKIHGNDWTRLPLLPHEDETVRWLHRPSTAATLNLSAVAAQGARVFAPYDVEFSKKLLNAARITWAAALENPEIFAPVEDGDDGGGAYNDSYVGDEFYWAATELYLTTGEEAFLDYILSSEVHTADVFPSGGIYWGNVAGLARIDLATVPSGLPNREEVIASVIEGARKYLDDQAMNGFGQAYRPPEGIYPWASNAHVLLNLVVLGAAYDISGDETFRQGVLKGIDYLLGRNALNISYVTGYGTVYSMNQHSRWFSNQLDASLPNPPVGTVAAGPNSEYWTWDPIANRLFRPQETPQQFCYIDDINSWSTNELAINWNSALTWIASFIADQDAAETDPHSDCEVSYRVVRKCKKSGAFKARVKLTYKGEEKLDDWALTWSYLGDQTVKRVKAGAARVTQEGAEVTLVPKKQKKLKPGKRRSFLIKGDRGTLADPTPGTFFLNGEACTSKRVFAYSQSACKWKL